MSRWWRAYDEAVDDPKLCLLTDKQHRAWFNLCCVCSQSGGHLPPIAAIAFKLRMTVDKARHIVAELAALKLVDVSDDGIATMHNWRGRQFQSDVSTERVKRFRKHKRNVSPPVSETPPETEADTDTETESKEERTRASALAFPFDAFWEKFPNKVSKQDAAKAFEKVRKSGAIAFDALMAGLDRYVQKTDDRPWCNPATWLNGGRWQDQPATVGKSSNGHGKPTVHEACDNLLAKLRSLDEPAPGGLRDGAGKTAVRVVSSGGRERP